MNPHSTGRNTPETANESSKRTDTPDRPLYTSRLGPVSVTLGETSDRVRRLTIEYEGGLLVSFASDDARRLFDTLGACLDLLDALNAGETLEAWQARTGQKHRKFPPGEVVATPGALRVLTAANLAPTEFLFRHLTGDWGDLGPEDQEANDRAVAEGNRILSSYQMPEGEARLWILTEWDRSVTTLLTPDEY